LVHLFDKEDSMSLSRRHFFRNLGFGSAGLLSTPFIIGRGHEALAFEAGVLQPPDDGGFIRISSNENARGPGKKTMDALRNTITPRVGRGYPPDYTGDLVSTIADFYGSRQGSRHRRHRLGADPRGWYARVLLGRQAPGDLGADVWNARPGGAPHRRTGEDDPRRQVDGTRHRRDGRGREGRGHDLLL
jgi:hypothetical protein